jgi:PBP1b-binding outer membrane lipoprotein LpoB
MKKTITLVILTTILLSSCNNSSENIDSTKESKTINTETQTEINNETTANITQPERKMDLY